MYFFIEDEELLENIMTYAIKSPIVWKKNLIENPSTTKIFWKSK